MLVTSSEHLFEKLLYLKENNINILHLIKPKSTEHKWEHPDILDFSESNLISIEDSHSWEHDKRPIVLTLDNLNIIINSRINGDGSFQLTENIFQHLDEYIQYGLLGRHRDDDKFIEKDNNREISFGAIRFILSFEHWFGEFSKYNLEITRDTYLKITDSSEKLTDIDIIEQGKLLCILMSFYWQKTIDFFHAQIRINNKENYQTREILKYSNHSVNDSPNYLLKNRYTTFYDFIEDLKYEQVLENSSIIRELVPRLIKIKNVDDISSFMILYNIIEKIRNYCISAPIKGNNLTIKEEFIFTKGKDATKTFIKNKIKEIKIIVDKSDVKDFVSKASDKVSFIKKTGLIDQFDSLLIYLGLTPEKYKLDFTNLIKIRNNIYHGKLPKEDVKPYNEQMLVLTYDMIIKLMT